MTHDEAVKLATELAPCPFCGVRLVAREIQQGWWDAVHEAGSESELACPCEFHDVNTYDDALAWNRRAPVPDSAEVVALRRVAEAARAFMEPNHVRREGSGHCNRCGFRWPCDVAELDAALLALSALREAKGATPEMPLSEERLADLLSKASPLPWFIDSKTGEISWGTPGDPSDTFTVEDPDNDALIVASVNNFSALLATVRRLTTERDAAVAAERELIVSYIDSHAASLDGISDETAEELECVADNIRQGCHRRAIRAGSTPAGEQPRSSLRESLDAAREAGEVSNGGGVMTSALDQQEGGDHYRKLPIQPVEYIHRNGIGFIEGSVIKYVTRWRAKGGVEDLRKARHFLDLLIQMETQA